jgi:hypothetical protein
MSAAAGDVAAPNPEAIRLVAQLSDNDPTVRHQAAWHLREIGLPALPALAEAAKSDDPELQIAARAAIKAIGVPLPEAGNGPYTTKVSPRRDDYFSADFGDGKRVVRIEGVSKKEGQKSPHDIKMTFTGLVDGKETTQIYTGKDEEDLKWNATPAWKFYHTIYNHESEMRAVRVTNARMYAQVKAAMDDQKFSEADRKQVLDRLHKFTAAASKSLAAIMYEPENAPQKMAEEYRESDSLRKFLAEKNLPIVDGPYELDPPPEARMGMYFLTDPKDFPHDAQTGLLVRIVAAGERAARIGVRPGDVIQRINGADIESASQLRPACLACPADMTIDVYRDGKTITLHEKAAGGQPGKR